MPRSHGEMPERLRGWHVETCGWCGHERDIHSYDDNDKPVCWECNRRFMRDMTGVDPALFDEDDE